MSCDLPPKAEDWQDRITKVAAASQLYIKQNRQGGDDLDKAQRFQHW
jgi:hypothetical protein